MTLLSVQNLSVDFGGSPVVEDVSFQIGKGEIVALVGESGSGKSVASLALLGLLPRAGISGSAVMTFRDGKSANLLGLSRRQKHGIAGRHISMIFQDPLSSLDPVHTIGMQLREVLGIHAALRGKAATDRAAELLHQVGIVDPAGCLNQIPQQLSGGMRQRVLIALATAGEPELLVADEPTTALDVTVQAQVLALLKDLRDRRGMAMIFITHNLAVASSVADRVITLYAGQVVEDASAEKFFARPGMPYSRALLGAAPRLETVIAGKNRLTALPGQVPMPGARGQGCRFAPRCEAMCLSPCLDSIPPLRAWQAGTETPHYVRCARDEVVGL